MKIGLVGLPLSGKTTLFNLLCETNIEVNDFLVWRNDPNQAIARVPDLRIDRLSKMYNPRKTIYAQIETIDLPGLRHGEGAGGNLFLQHVRQVDALVQVVRAFSADVEHVFGDVNPLRDVDTIQAELLLADIDLVEKRILRINEGRKITAEHRLELVVLEKCLQALSVEQPMSSLELSEAERELISHYGFLTQMPQLIACNLDEDQFRQGDFPYREQLLQWAKKREVPVMILSAAIEEEIAKLPYDDRSLFMEDLGIAEPGAYRLAQSMYALVDLISFFTVGEDEVRAWTITAGLDAKKAAGKIHSDLERGFIRAETVSSDDLLTFGSMAKLKERGLVRVEGKDYIVRDGDVLHIRFNV